ncbi:hypothetical protein HPB47_023139 [Ixodes persulcatus]|uniref:Uncharacterized protein n=1 Tax=Ixodes persulcatus TaxID=34615 RepID=A0AC60Q7T2_IXOPE|nr:hypothetical protein HPB47_023139 [Ixodes persulcatus]
MPYSKMYPMQQMRTPKRECYSSYASTLRGPGAEADSNSELLMDVSEVVDASGDTLPTQEVSAEHTPPGPNECHASAEKNIEPPQISDATEGEATSTQECKDERTQQPSEAPRQSADPADKSTDYENEDDPEATMDTTHSTSKDTNESKRKKKKKKDIPPVTVATSGICKNCNYKADLVHLMWSCPLYNLPRQRALDLITNAPVPASLNAWACPDTTISPKHALELWEALLTFIRDPTAPPVGDRLLPATAKRIRPPPPSSTKALKP